MSAGPASPRASGFDQSLATGTDRQYTDSSQLVPTRLRPQPAAIVDTSDDQPSPYSEAPSYADGVVKQEEDGHVSRPLLLPPPRSRASEMRHNAYLVAMYLLSLIGVQHDVLNHLFRLSFFLVKFMSVMRPCWPYMTRLEVSVPLIMIAALDLRVPDPSTSVMARRTVAGEIQFGPSRFRGMGWSMVLLVLHLAVVWIVGRWDALCVTTSRDIWESW